MNLEETYVATWCTTNCPTSCNRHVHEAKEEVECFTNADFVKRDYARWMERLNLPL